MKFKLKQVNQICPKCKSKKNSPHPQQIILTEKQQNNQEIKRTLLNEQ